MAMTLPTEARPAPEFLADAVRSLKAGRTEDAESYCRRAIAARQEDPAGHHLLGVVLMQGRRYREAAACFNRAVELRPDDTGYIYALMTALKASGQAADALEVCERLVRLDPANGKALVELAEAALVDGRNEAALDLYRRASAAEPDNATAWRGLGLARMRLDQRHEAEEALRRAIDLDPDDPRTAADLARLLTVEARWAEAADLLASVAARDDGNAEPLMLLGWCREQEGNHAGAADAYARAVTVDPARAEAHYNLGVALGNLDDGDRAVASYRRALALQPRMAVAAFNMGVVLERRGALEDAIPAYRRALEAEPDRHDARLNLMQVLRQCGRLEDAIDESERLLIEQPENAKAHFNKGLALLALGRLENGWPEYEWRERDPEIFSRLGLPAFGQPRWTGQSLIGKRLLVFCEQGFGDAIQFVRYLPMVKARGPRIVLQCHDRLVDLLRTVSGVDEVISKKRVLDPANAIDYVVSVMSLPGLFRTSMATIPAEVPYLHPDPERVARWRGRFDERAVNVGIVWSGNPKNPVNARRACTPDMFRALAAVPGVQLYNLQTGTPASQIESVRFERPPVKVGNELADFADTAAVLAHLDLIVSTCTATVHLAGALGRPTWVALHDQPDWRWFRHREDSPWYPTLKLFRQPTAGDWQSVFDRMARELDDLARQTLERR
jgi:tetratricopeptide (TPR) repeat protein